MNIHHLLLLIPLLLFVGGCATAPEIRTASAVNLPRFMDDWYVVGAIPIFLEKDAFNPVESYARGEGNRIETTYRFNKGSFDGPLKTYHPTGFVTDDPSNAVWKMQFLWPFKADYRIVYINEPHTLTLIGRPQRDYLWIMSKTPQVDEADYQAVVDIAVEEGYEREAIVRMPQQPLGKRAANSAP